MADMVTINRAGPEQMLDNTDYDAMPAEARLLDPALKPRGLSAQHIFMIGTLSLAGMVVLIIIAAITRLAMCWDLNEGTAQCYAANGFFWLSVAMLVIVPVTVLVRYIWTSIVTTKATASRAMISRDQFGNPVAVQLLENLDMQTYVNMFNTNMQASVLKAPYQQLPKGLNNYSTHNTATAAPAQLTAPVDAGINVGPMPVDDWLAYIDTRAHVMLAAETGGGKSTTAKAILAQRIEAGDDVLVIDPHASQWFDLTSYGGGENWVEVEEYMRHIIAEYERRQAERQRYKAETGKELETSHFPRLTVLLDEANGTKIALDSRYSGKEAKNSPWEPFIKVLGSGARKVNISVIVLVQSANVEDLGISGAMRNNFTRICLDSKTIKLMINTEEQDPARKKALHAALKNHKYPAVALIGSEVFLLDREGLDKIEAPDTKGAEWLPPAEYSTVRACDEHEEASFDLLSGLLTRTNERTEWSDEEKIAYLAELIQQGETRESIRKNNLTPFTWADALYTAANKRPRALKEV